jgi:hypothetical protein
MTTSMPTALATGLLIAVAAYAGLRGVRLLARGARDADSLAVIRGIRGVVVAVAALALAGGVAWEERGLLAFGAVFLAEELYETGVVALALRLNRS